MVRIWGSDQVVVNIVVMATGFVYLDAAGTLFRLRTSVGEVYATLAREFDMQPDPSELGRSFRREFRKRGPLAFPNAPAHEVEFLERAWWRELVRSTFDAGMDSQTFEAYFERLYEAFAGSERWQLFPETLETLVQLRGHGFKLGVLSNFDSRLTQILRGLRIDEFFDVVVISSLAGVAKPAPEIFALAARRSGYPPSRLVHVGDGIEDDYLGAQNSGWTGFLVDRQNQHRAVPESHRLSSLAELPQRLCSGS